MLKVPSGSTVPVPTTVPAALVTEMSAPGSPSPVSTMPSSSRTRLVGASGAVVSVVEAVPGTETLPAASLRTTSSSAPSAWGGLSVIVNVPPAPTVPVPTTTPSAVVTVTAAPASPLPVSCAPFGVTTRLVGASGGVRSGVVAVPGPDSLPAVSVRTTLSDPPSVFGVVRVMEKLPLVPTVPVPTMLSSASLMVTAAPGSPLPLTIVPVALTLRLVGVSGASRSGVGTVPG
ncbi:hypothetical protein D3C73_505380 [compost metagenome]